MTAPTEKPVRHQHQAAKEQWAQKCGDGDFLRSHDMACKKGGKRPPKR